MPADSISDATTELQGDAARHPVVRESDGSRARGQLDAGRLDHIVARH
jgi:hypothetical protein